MGSKGRPQAVGVSEILEYYESADQPYLTAASVADHFECSRQTARRRLSTLADSDALLVDTRSKTNIYYQPESTDEKVIPFPSQRKLMVVNQTDKTKEKIERFANVRAQFGPHVLYAFKRTSIDLPDCRTDDDVRRFVRDICPNPDLVEKLVSSWWRKFTAVAYTENGSPQLRAKSADRLDDILAVLDENAVEAHVNERTIQLVEETASQQLELVARNHIISDRRDESLRKTEVLKPVINKDVDGLDTFHYRIIGIDADWQVHVWNRVDQSIEVIVDGAVETTIEIEAEALPIEEYQEHVIESIDGGWREFYG